MLARTPHPGTQHGDAVRRRGHNIEAQCACPLAAPARNLAPDALPKIFPRMPCPKNSRRGALQKDFVEGFFDAQNFAPDAQPKTNPMPCPKIMPCPKKDALPQKKMPCPKVATSCFCSCICLGGPVFFGAARIWGPAILGSPNYFWARIFGQPGIFLGT